MRHLAEHCRRVRACAPQHARRALALLCLVLVGLLACTPAPRYAHAPASAVLRDEAGKAEALSELVKRSRLSVLLFFSADCPVQKAHDARVRAIVDRYGPRGVSFAAVASETGVDLPAERAAARQRGLGMPVLEDRGAVLADALGVEFSTHVVVLDPSGAVLYSGGLDSDRSHLSPNAERWLEQALDAALEGRPIAKAHTEPLGCPLRKH